MRSLRIIVWIMVGWLGASCANPVEPVAGDSAELRGASGSAAPGKRCKIDAPGAQCAPAEVCDITGSYLGIGHCVPNPEGRTCGPSAGMHICPTGYKCILKGSSIGHCAEAK
jgi:hypothetical protein